MSPSKEVLKHYPYAKIEKVKNHYEVQLHTLNDGYHVLGQGKNRRCAWKAAYNNMNN